MRIDGRTFRSKTRPRTSRAATSSSFVVLVGLTRFELVTPRLSSVCSNQLSYRPGPVLSKLDRRANKALENQIDLGFDASRQTRAFAFANA